MRRRGGHPFHLESLLNVASGCPCAIKNGIVADMNALIVEDDPKQADYLRTALDEFGIGSCVKKDGESGLKAILDGGFDIVLLDIRLPKMNGIDVIQAAKRSGSRTPIILLTVQDAIRIRCTGLDAGADDFLAKPFSFDELKSRINAVLRRSKPQSVPSVLHFEDLDMDTTTHTVTRGKRTIPLTHQEYILLECLLRSPREAVRRQHLIKMVWHCGNISKNVIDVRLCNLRQKINGPEERPLIRTIKGFGYVLD